MDIRNLKSFIINLESKPEQYNILNKQLSNYGFTNIERWNATIGKNLVPVINKTTQLKVNEVPVTLQAYVDLNQGRSFHRSLSSKGALGCYMSHVSIWRWLLNQPDLDRVLIFEDDAIIASEERLKTINESLNSISQPFDFFSFGYLNTDRGETYKINDFISLYSGEFWGLQAYIITKSGVEKLLKYIFPIDMQIDSYIGLVAEYDPSFKLYITNTNLVQQRTHISTIQDICMKCKIIDLYDIIYRYKYIIILLILIVIILLIYKFN
jgi:GR25 family glycosyltransferase involved in LPS biosynthesis